MYAWIRERLHWCFAGLALGTLPFGVVWALDDVAGGWLPVRGLFCLIVAIGFAALAVSQHTDDADRRHRERLERMRRLHGGR